MVNLLGMRDFFGVRDPKDNLYRLVGAHDELANRTRELWRVAEPFLEAGRPEMAANDFHATYWELYLTVALLNQRLPLRRREQRRTPSGGPDLELDGPAWVEAIVATAGRTEDRVPGPEYDGGVAAQWMPERELLLRIRAAIEAKRDKHGEYVGKGVIRGDEPFVIAINGGMLPLARIESDIPRVVRAVFGIGELTVILDGDTLALVKEEYAQLPSISSRSTEVLLDVFLRPEYAFVSALLWGSADVANQPNAPGRDLIVVHNPTTAVPLALGWIKEGREYWAEEGQLNCHEWWRENVRAG